MNKIVKLYYPNLYEAAKILGASRSPKEILHTLVEIVAKALGAKGCSLMLLSPDKKHLFHIVAYGLSDWYMRKGPVSADKSLSKALEGQAVAVMKAAEDKRIQYRQQAQQEGIASILSVPLTLRDEIIGVIRVYTGEIHRFTRSEIYFTNAVASLSAIAFDNARFNKSVQRNNEKLKQDLEELKQLIEMERPLWPS
jgi:GAF domain-containing protein